ncbi:hypothetical protein [Oceanirhabdus sp. W0125-5]|uniref:hypothetical protein n=1 Tax=Oceanirhabdus sp. W0125-5 TaxID=2999116 RepID=UPI0022F318CF|nr:hypothetical protein [Oceanirhabdus sp. W0125-5]WBW97886.1 hypothetical protein OW730_03650 [Oceanirhabdus sp. W0125-5]
MEKFKNEYINVTNTVIRKLNEMAKKLREEGEVDEAKYKIIKANVEDIHLKLFMVAYNNVFVKVNHECLRGIVEEEIDDKEKLIKCYEFLSNKVTQPWRDNLEKYLNLEILDKSIIEEVKIEHSELILQVFKNMIHGKSNAIIKNK